MIGRIRRPIDFERALGMPPRSRSPHFSVHHLAASPARRAPHKAASAAEFSTPVAIDRDALVDDSRPDTPTARWLGAVLPKRHARRAVTRNLLKRQIRAAVARQADQLPAGLWVVRLRAPIDRARFSSAASSALKHAMREELDALLAGAIAAPVRRTRRS